MPLGQLLPRLVPIIGIFKTLKLPFKVWNREIFGNLDRNIVALIAFTNI